MVIFFDIKDIIFVEAEDSKFYTSWIDEVLGNKHSMMLPLLLSCYSVVSSSSYLTELAWFLLQNHSSLLMSPVIEEMQENRLVGIKIIDLSAAFDMVDQKLLIQRLELVWVEN